MVLGSVWARNSSAVQCPFRRFPEGLESKKEIADIATCVVPGLRHRTWMANVNDWICGNVQRHSVRDRVLQ